MDWKDLLGEAYEDGMTDEAARAAFDNMYIPKADHEKEAAKSKALIDTYSAQIAETKRKERERMSEEEKKQADIQAQIEKDREEKESYRSKLEMREQQDVYESMGYSKDMSKELAEKFVSGSKEDFNSLLKIANDKRAAEQRSAWEKEYKITPPAGNGGNKVDYSKQIAEAQANGDMALYAALVRQQAEANNKK